jgi:hypothetical protein
MCFCVSQYGTSDADLAAAIHYCYENCELHCDSMAILMMQVNGFLKMKQRFRQILPDFTFLLHEALMTSLLMTKKYF